MLQWFGIKNYRNNAKLFVTMFFLVLRFIVSILLYPEYICTHVCTLRCQIVPPQLINFLIFPAPPEVIRTPCINFKEIDFFTNPSSHFLSLLVLSMATIQGKMEFLLSFYNHLEPFLKFQPPLHLFWPLFINM